MLMHNCTTFTQWLIKVWLYPNFLRDKQAPGFRGYNFSVMGWKVQQVGIKVVLKITKWFMLKSGLNGESIASFDNQPFLQPITKLIGSHSGKQTIPSYTVLFTAHSIEILGDKRPRTSNFNHKQWPCGTWSPDCELFMLANPRNTKTSSPCTITREESLGCTSTIQTVCAARHAHVNTQCMHSVTWDVI